MDTSKYDNAFVIVFLSFNKSLFFNEGVNFSTRKNLLKNTDFEQTLPQYFLGKLFEGLKHHKQKKIEFSFINSYLGFSFMQVYIDKGKGID